MPTAVRHVVVEADGGARGNPGPAAYGAVVKDAATHTVLAERAEAIGVATNNVAEYRGLIAGLELARQHAPYAAVEVRMDSKLVVEQMAGRWKVKHPDLVPLALQARRLAPAQVTWTWVPRSQNAYADQLLNAALDAGVAGRPRRPFSELRAATTVLLLYTEAGQHTEAAAVAEWLQVQGGVDAVWTSPRRHSREPATVLAERLRVPIHVDTDLCEPALTPGQPVDTVARRLELARDRLVGAHPDGRLVAVTDATAIKVLVCTTLGAPLDAVQRLDLPPGSVTELRWSADGGPALRAFGVPPTPVRT